MKKIKYQIAEEEFHSNIPGFQSTLLNQSFVFYFKNGEFITEELAELNYLYVIIKGRAKVVTTQENGRRIILQFLSHEDLVGDLTIIKAEEDIKDVISMGETICLGVPIEIVTKELMPNNDFLLFLSQYIGKKLILRMNHFKEQQTQELKIRLAKLFLEISSDSIYQEKHIEIAEYLGVSYRHFLHTFKFFKDEKMVLKKGQHYEIDKSALENFINNQKN